MNFSSVSAGMSFPSSGLVRKHDEVLAMAADYADSFLHATEDRGAGAAFRKIPSGVGGQTPSRELEGNSLLLDVGGSNTKVYIRVNGKITLLANIPNEKLDYIEKGDEGKLPIERYSKNLFKEIEKKLIEKETGLKLSDFKNLAICWSNPFTLKALEGDSIKGISAVVDGAYNKLEWFVANLPQGFDLGNLFINEAKQNSMVLEVFGIVNDSTLTIKALRGANLGGVASTGTNFLIVDPETLLLFVSECGGVPASVAALKPDSMPVKVYKAWHDFFGKYPTNEELSAKCGMAKQFIAGLLTLSNEDPNEYAALKEILLTKERLDQIRTVDKDGKEKYDDKIIKFLFDNPKFPGEEKLPGFLKGMDRLLWGKNYHKLRALALDVVEASGQMAGILAAASAAPLIAADKAKRAVRNEGFICAFDSSCAGHYGPDYLDAAVKAYQSVLANSGNWGELRHLPVGSDSSNTLSIGGFAFIDSLAQVP